MSIADLIVRCVVEIESIAKDIYRQETRLEPKNPGTCITWMEKHWNIQKNMIINKYANKNFKLLKNNMNSLGLEIFWDEDRFCVAPFTRRSIESAIDLNVIN